MMVIKCKMCGGDIELSPDKTFGVCEFCGSTMTLPKIDDEQRAAAFNRGNHFRRQGEFDKALLVYEHIIEEDERDAEAHWCCALCRFGIEYVKDPESGGYVPTCHRASFSSFLEDIDYQAALKYADKVAREQYKKDGEKIVQVQKRILATIQKEEDFDVFLCYKETDGEGERTVDSTLAQEIYYQLTEEGWRVFFSRITLEDKGGQEYEPYIFAALHSARVMVVVGTRPEYLNAVWVKNEWSRYLALVKKDRKRLLIPCYRDMDPYDLPEPLSVLQSYDMGKIGFLQDLIHGINKVLGSGKKPEGREKEAVRAGSGANAEALLKRGYMALEDGEWSRANNFFEHTLNMDAECAKAFGGKALAAEECHSLKELAEKHQRIHHTEGKEQSIPEERKRIEEAGKKYEIPGYLERQEIEELFEGFDRTYRSESEEIESQREGERSYFSSHKLMGRAMRYAEGEYAEELKRVRDSVEEALTKAAAKAQEEEKDRKEVTGRRYRLFLDEAEKQARELSEKASRRREEEYLEACQKIGNPREPEKSGSVGDLSDAARIFDKCNDYRDSRELAEKCREGIKAIKEEERRQKELLKEREEIRKKIFFIVSTIAALAMVIIVTVIVPACQYKKAKALLEAGNFDEAARIFDELKDYKDAEERRDATQYKKAEALLEAGNLGEAAKIFKTVENYKDAKSRSDSVQYENAQALLSSKKFIEAAMAFGSLGDYKDAREQSYSLWDKIAVHKIISARNNHTIGLTSQGRVMATNYPEDIYKDRYDVTWWKNIIDISAGRFHAVGLKSDGTVVTTIIQKAVNYGQCDVKNWTDIVDIAAGSQHTVGLKSDGTVIAVGKNENGQCDVADWTGIIAVEAGEKITVGLKSDGTIVMAGDNSDGQYDISSWKDIVKVAVGENHIVGLKSDGTVVATGLKENGQCNVSWWTDIIAVAAGEAHSVGLKKDGTVIATHCYGRKYLGQSDVSSWSDIVEVCAGGEHTIGLKSDGTLIAAGDNSKEQCDVENWRNIKLPK